MITKDPLTFVVPVNNENIFKNNFLASPLFEVIKPEIISQRGFTSASKAYNDAIDRSKNDIIIFAHQDMWFPVFWEKELSRFLNYLKESDPNWGVIGCYGHNRYEQVWKGEGYLYCVGNKKILGNLLAYPMPVTILDEVVLMIRKSSGLRFDECLPHFHLYGTDICMISKSKGMNCYAISAFCIHNTKKIHVLPNNFFDCYRYIKRKWYNILPIEATCIRISKYDLYTHIKYKYFRKYKYKILNFKGKNINENNVGLLDPLILFRRLQNEYKLNL